MTGSKRRLTLGRREVLAGVGRVAAGMAGGVLGADLFGGAVAAQAVGNGVPHAIVTIHRATHEDTLLALARSQGLGYVEMIAANPGIDPWLPGAGTEVVLPTVHLIPDVPREGIAVNLAEMRLYYFTGDGGTITTYPLGIGREGRGTPTGGTRVERKTENPSWYPPASIRAERPELPSVVPPGPDNPLGHRALYLGWPAYLIHGTHQPWGVGRRVSAGCIRMYPEDVERLYELVPIGTRVTVVDQPFKFAWVEGDLYMEASPTQRQADEIELYGQFEVDMPVDLAETAEMAAGDERGRLDWTTMRRAALERRGFPIRVTRPA